MKHRYIILAAVLIAPFLTSCSLDEDLTGQPTADKFFENISDFTGFMAGAYNPLISLYGTDVPYVAGAGAEDVYTSIVRWRGFERADINSVGNPDELTSELWNSCYSSISSCNTIISIIAQNTKVPAGELDPIRGEALFLRAFNYFNMVRWFGKVPLLLEHNQSNAATEKESEISVIYAQIVDDLQNAENLLPESQSEPDKPSRYAAAALLSKVYLAMAGYPLYETSCYSLARDEAEKVISSGNYELESNFFNLWLYDNRYINSEFIFAFYASSTNGTGGYVNRAIRPDDHGEGGWADWTSDKRFLEKFPRGDNSRYNGTFYLTLLDGASYTESGEGQPYVGKLRDGGSKSGGYYGAPSANLADGFYCMLRLSDILLVYAEAANMAEGNPSAAAYDAINRVRRRAGLTELSGLTSAKFDQAVLDERNWELAFECNRWFDICRKHILEETIKAYYPDATIDDHNYLLPKPYEQLTIMTGIEQNPGY